MVIMEIVVAYRSINQTGRDKIYSVSIAAVLFYKKDMMYLVMYGGRRKSSCYTESKAALMSKRATAE